MKSKPLNLRDFFLPKKPMFFFVEIHSIDCVLSFHCDSFSYTNIYKANPSSAYDGGVLSSLLKWRGKNPGKKKKLR